MYNYLYFLVLLYHGHWKCRHIGADIKYKLVSMLASEITRIAEISKL